MASPSQPDRPSDADDTNNVGEMEPLLGRPGDATQKPDAPLISNLYLGTGWIAQAGALLLVALIWAQVFLNPLLPLFSPHPLLQSTGVLVVVQAILILQPTWAPSAKVTGARTHAVLHLLSFLIFAAGISVIETNKVRSGNPHFHSVHAYLGVTTAVALLAQYLLGLVIWGVPAVLGGVDRAKRLYRVHRWTGYFVFVLLLATVISATKTDYNLKVLDIKLWSVCVAVGLILIGVLPRVSLQKLGVRRPEAD